MTINLENYEIDRIFGIEKYEKEQTYDIEVENVHAFYARNDENDYSSISHNSAHISLMDISHPDIEKFVTVKQGDSTKLLTQFNISVKMTDKFVDTVPEDENKLYIDMLDGSKLELNPEEKLEIDGVVVFAKDYYSSKKLESSND